MSDIKMCDMCGTIFPTTQEGWTAMERTVFRSQDDYSPTRPQITLHACPSCSGHGVEVKPRLPELSRKVIDNDPPHRTT